MQGPLLAINTNNMSYHLERTRQSAERERDRKDAPDVSTRATKRTVTNTNGLDKLAYCNQYQHRQANNNAEGYSLPDTNAKRQACILPRTDPRASNPLMFFWCPCMVINVNVQYNGGLLTDIILSTQGYYQWGTRLNTM